LSNEKYALKGDAGNYLARCNNCIPGTRYPDAAFMHVAEVQLASAPWAQFTLKQLASGKYALQADSGKYLARCNNCIPGGSYPDSAFVHVTEAELMGSPWAHWDLIIVP
jgi:hypothetical protein